MNREMDGLRRNAGERGASCMGSGLKRGRRPRLGFLGLGWIGQHRLQAVAESGMADITAVADTDFAAASRSAATFPGTIPAAGLDDLLAMDLDGIVIATPTALHASQTIAALEAGVAVFCQKPLGTAAAETRGAIAAARRRNRLLGVDMSYRFVRAVEIIRRLAREGAIGEVYAMDLVFHNAYGPDKPWYYERGQSGGGCLIDLGIHLVDIAVWTAGSARVDRVTSRLFANGSPVVNLRASLEDYTVARLDFSSGATATLSCSWHLAAGQDAVIAFTLFGTKGGLRCANVGGSFYDFQAEHMVGTSRRVLVEPPDAWGGRAAVHWAERLAAGSGYDPEIESAGEVAEIIDRIYAQQ